MTRAAAFAEARAAFHADVGRFLSIDGGVPANADKDSRVSVEIARGIAARIGARTERARLSGQAAGKAFETACSEFVRRTFLELGHLRPGKWRILHVHGRDRLEIAQYDQYVHLQELAALAKANPALSAALGSDYMIAPDIVVAREPEDDTAINARAPLVDSATATLASLRKRDGAAPLLHASISCKWTIRSDRAQNARSEGLNLVRNRKGRLPHIVVATGEPLPNRLASISLGTGDIDCVYHFALPELREAVAALGHGDTTEMLDTMIGGKRLKDISDLPLDLAI